MSWSADIADPDLMRCKLHDPDYKYERYLEIANAINEKCSVRHLTSLTLPQRLQAWPQYRYKHPSELGWEDTVWWKMYYIFSGSSGYEFFVNHNDNGGNWDGLTSMAPKWNIYTAALSYLGESEVPYACNNDLALWLNQQYKLLNLCRWTRLDNTNFNGENGQRKTVNAGSWAACEAAFDAAAWASYNNTVNYFHYGANEAGGTYTKTADRMRPYWSSLSTDFDHSADYYIMPESDSGFEIIGNVDQQDKYNLAYTDAEANASMRTVNYFTDANLAAGMTDPLSNPRAHDVDKSPNYKIYGIFKWDGANGMSYID